VIGVTEKQNYTIEVQIYYALVRNAGVVGVEGVVIDLDNFVEVVVGQVDDGSLVGQKFKKFVEDIGYRSG